MRRIALFAAAVAALAMAAPAQAVIVNYTFSGTGTGTMALDLTGGAYTLNSLNLTLGTATFTTANSSMAPFGLPLYLVGGNLNGIGSISMSTDDFDFRFDPSLASQTAQPFGWVNAGGLIHDSDNDILNITQVTVVNRGVPEPASWAMMLLGFGGIGLAMRRRKRVAALV